MAGEPILRLPKLGVLLINSDLVVQAFNPTLSLRRFVPYKLLPTRLPTPAAGTAARGADRGAWLQAARSPHGDVSQREVQTAVHLCEHLLHLQRQQRRQLGSLAGSLHQLASQAALMYSFASAATPHSQVRCRVRGQALEGRHQLFCGLPGLLSCIALAAADVRDEALLPVCLVSCMLWMQAWLQASVQSAASALLDLEHSLTHHSRLLEAAAAVETAKQRREPLQAARAVTEQGLQRCRACKAQLVGAMRQPLACLGRVHDEQAVWGAMMEGSPAVLPCSLAETVRAIQQVWYWMCLRIMKCCSLPVLTQCPASAALCLCYCFELLLISRRPAACRRLVSQVHSELAVPLHTMSCFCCQAQVELLSYAGPAAVAGRGRCS